MEIKDQQTWRVTVSLWPIMTNISQKMLKSNLQLKPSWLLIKAIVSSRFSLLPIHCISFGSQHRPVSLFCSPKHGSQVPLLPPRWLLGCLLYEYLWIKIENMSRLMKTENFSEFAYLDIFAHRLTSNLMVLTMGWSTLIHRCRPQDGWFSPRCGGGRQETGRTIRDSALLHLSALVFQKWLGGFCYPLKKCHIAIEQLSLIYPWNNCHL